MGSVFGLMSRIWTAFNPPKVAKRDDALRFGILGAANIAPSAFIWPARSHPEVIVQAVAARDKARAEAYAKKHGIPEVKDNYQAILDDTTIDAIYIPLPMGLHYEWALRALAKGKHVLVEKPAVSNATDAEKLLRSPLLQGPNAPVLLEAFHYRFQPGWQFFLTLVDPPNVEHVSSVASLPRAMFSPDDLRFNYEIGGGTTLDLGTYAVSNLRLVFAAEPEECIEATPRLCPPPRELCEEAISAKFRFPNGGIGEIRSDLQSTYGAIAIPSTSVTHRAVTVKDHQPATEEKTMRRKLYFKNFMISTYWHRIDVEDEFVIRDKATGSIKKKWTEKKSHKIYTFKDAGIDQPGEPYWTSYRHQLEQFVNRIRGRPGSGLWVSTEDSLLQSKALDSIYTKANLPLRPIESSKLDMAALS